MRQQLVLTKKRYLTLLTSVVIVGILVFISLLYLVNENQKLETKVLNQSIAIEKFEEKAKQKSPKKEMKEELKKAQVKIIFLEKQVEAQNEIIERLRKESIYKD